MKNNKKLIAIVGAIVLILVGFIVYLLQDSDDITNRTGAGQTINFQGAELKEEADGKLVWALSAETINYDPRTKSIVLTNLTGHFYQDDVTTTVIAPHAVLSSDRNTIDVDGGITATNTDKDRLVTEAIHFDNKTKQFTSQSAFTYEGKDATLVGDKLEGNMSLKKIKAIGNAKLTKK